MIKRYKVDTRDGSAHTHIKVSRTIAESRVERERDLKNNLSVDHTLYLSMNEWEIYKKAHNLKRLDHDTK